MKHRLLFGLAFTAALLFGTGAVAAGVPFSADMIQTSGGKTTKIRYFQGDQKMRMEMKGEDGQTVASIIDVKARRMLQLIPAEKMYLEMPLGGDTAAWAADQKTRDEYYDMKPAGTETVNGYLCDRYELIPKKQGLEKATTWIARKLGYPIKTVGQNYTMELINIKEGAQPASLFEVPRGFRKMPGMGDLHRGMMKDRSSADDDETPSTQASSPREPSEVEKDAREIGQDARGEVKGAVKDEIRDVIRQGVRGIFGR